MLLTMVAGTYGNRNVQEGGDNIGMRDEHFNLDKRVPILFKGDF